VLAEKNLTNSRKLATSALMGLWIYSILLWAYVVADNLINHFAHQYSPLSVYVPVPEDLVAVTAFVTSFVAFVAWEYLRSS
jgi:hypothetical protein